MKNVRTPQGGGIILTHTVYVRKVLLQSRGLKSLRSYRFVFLSCMQTMDLQTKVHVSNLRDPVSRCRPRQTGI